MAFAAPALAQSQPVSPVGATRADASATPESATVDMRVEAVGDGAYFVQGQSAMGSAANQNFISNAAFVVADGGVLVIDALGSPPLAQRLLQEIRKVTPLPIRYVVVTHYHADHIYGLQVFKQEGAQIIAHASAREYIGSETARQRLAISREELFPWVDEHTRVIEPDRYVGEHGSEADVPLRIGRSEFLLRHVGPSHTLEDLVVWQPSTGVLFAGDLVFRGRVPFVGNADSRSWVAALDRMIALRPRMMLPGHGPVSRSPEADLRATRDYLAYLRQTMGEAARNLEPFDEAYARTDWSRFAGIPLFQAANRMNAYNIYLQMESESK
ncbi:MBL fold metallo-hydrolase [Sphaerotilus microaerophilus]|uniref:MBL fold metallo-hydrolase n=2 Tax=Sphaerotilus microaerophilus TaxID=2914710 RepID=A0ABN6PXE1_9BURK|nr:MBL fold metallo-hydrolase [Sphaerotilus sp. FB-5]